MNRGTITLVLVVLLATTIGAPAASAHHCDTKINVYGRTAVAPVPPPPYLSQTAGICVRVLGQYGVEEHMLPPNTDQVLVRVLGDYGSGVPSVRVILHGLGFLGQEYPAYRTLNQGGLYSYDLPSWIPLPNGPTDGELTVSVVGPGGHVNTVKYRTTLTIVPPTLPPIPPAP